MKSSVRLAEFTPHLPAPLQDGLDEALKQAEVQPELHRSVSCADLQPADTKTFIGYASTRTVDRDGEVIVPRGMDLSQFLKSPVLLWGHRWSDPPIGKDLLIENDGYGLKTKSQLADTALANDLWTLVSKAMLRTSSIGFIPLQWVLPDHKDYGGLMDMARKWPEWQAKAEPRAFVTKAVLLEHSLVSVPANIDALITSVKQFNLATLAKSLKLEAADDKTDKKRMEGGQQEGKAAGELQVPQGGAAPAPAGRMVETPPAAPYVKLLKTPDQVQIEFEAETRRLVLEEIRRRMGRV